MIICAKPWPALSIKQNVAIFSNLGYKQIRYDPNTTIFRKARTGTPLESFKKDFEAVQKVGMSIEEFHSYAVAFDEFKKRVDVYIEMMTLADVKFYVQHMSEEMTQHKDELNEIIKRFKDAGIYFCVENEFVFEGFSAYNVNFEVMDSILKTFPDAKVCLDIGHAFMVGIEPYE
ncbi:sugar phosphate isomerase/epimerase, partial [Candidatus Woesearchaeota archaeon]|nr:sugar phosphate isomerase/epimerase [Candidatus Woesearchaeota archaeon]